MMRATAWTFLTLVLVGSWLGCGPVTDPKTQQTAELTYYRDIKPIMDAKCANCHTQDNIGPMPLDSYEMAHKFRDFSKLQIEQNKMPPWKGNDQCNEYTNNIALTAEERQKLLRWIEIGSPQGDPKDTPPTQTKSSGLEKADLTLTLPVAYVPTKTPDDYRCFVVDWPQTSTTYITGYHVKAGNRKIAHHLIAYVVAPKDVPKLLDLDNKEEGPGYTCFGGPKVNAGWVGAWAPGGGAQLYPKGTGIKIEPGSKIVLQMHYNVLQSNPEPDQSKIEFQLADKVEKEGLLVPYSNLLGGWNGKGMEIPAGQSDVKHEFKADIVSLLKARSAPKLESITIHSATLHLHLLGKSAKLYVKRSDAKEDCMLDIPKWDFNWQYMYDLKTPITLKAGDELGIVCHWDNSPENQPIIDGKRVIPGNVYWGDGTRDEMCLGVVYLTYNTTP